MVHTITRIERRPRGLAAVSLEGEAEACLLPLETLVEHGLHEGALLEPAAWAALRSQARERLALRRGLELLARRFRTEAELRRALERQFAPDEVERAVARLKEMRYLDDAAWAERYVGSTRARHHGRALLGAEMRRHGVSAEDAAGALEPHDDLNAALEAGRRRMPSLARLEAAVRRRRLYDFLRRRGFADETAREALGRLLGPEAG
jgi:regulatory protein